jgi:hypothetical protein
MQLRLNAGMIPQIQIIPDLLCLTLVVLCFTWGSFPMLGSQIIWEIQWYLRFKTNLRELRFHPFLHKCLWLLTLTFLKLFIWWLVLTFHTSNSDSEDSLVCVRILKVIKVEFVYVVFVIDFSNICTFLKRDLV